MKIGFNKVDITPPVGIRLGGYAHRYGRPSEKVHDPLYAGVVIFESGENTVAIIFSDLLGINKTFSNRVKDRISGKIGIRRENIMFTTIHNHSAPETIIPMWPNTFPYSRKEKNVLDRWMREMEDKIVDSAERAFQNLDKGYIKMGKGRVSDVSYNRSFKNGVIDPDLTYLYIFSGGERIVISNFACHPVCNIDLGISADYPGNFSQKLFKRGIINFFTTGCTGDIDPLKKGREFIEYMGSRLLSTFFHTIENVSELKNSQLKISSREIELKFRDPPDLETAEKRFREIYKKCIDKIEEEKCFVDLLYADEELAIARENRRSTKTLIQGFSMGGEFLFITIPGEMFAEIGLEFKRRSYENGFKHIIISNYSNDYIGYIPIQRAFHLNTYETRLARWSRVTEDAEKIFLDKMTKLMYDLKL